MDNILVMSIEVNTYSLLPKYIGMFIHHTEKNIIRTSNFLYYSYLIYSINDFTYFQDLINRGSKKQEKVLLNVKNELYIWTTKKGNAIYIFGMEIINTFTKPNFRNYSNSMFPE